MESRDAWRFCFRYWINVINALRQGRNATLKYLTPLTNPFPFTFPRSFVKIPRDSTLATLCFSVETYWGLQIKPTQSSFLSRRKSAVWEKLHKRGIGSTVFLYAQDRKQTVRRERHNVYSLTFEHLLSFLCKEIKGIHLLSGFALLLITLFKQLFIYNLCVYWLTVSWHCPQSFVLISCGESPRWSILC